MLDTILFDMGGTIEDICYNEETSARVTAKLIEMLEGEGVTITDTPAQFWEKIWKGVLKYKEWSMKYDLEAKPEEIWPDYYFSEFDFDRDMVIRRAEDFAYLWEITYFTRVLRPNVRETLEALKQRGYKLGIISNTAAMFSVFHVLDQYGIREYFQDVTLSSITGYRKPHPRIFEISMYQMQSKPENSVYVGDTMSRDIIGSKKYGFAKAIQIQSFMTAGSDLKVKNTEFAPDHVISDLYDLVGILDAAH